MCRGCEFSDKFHYNNFEIEVLWDLRDDLAHYILPRLKAFREECLCYPDELTEESWKDVLTKMIKAFELLVKDKWKAETLEKDNLTLEEGMNLFAEYFCALWW